MGFLDFIPVIGDVVNGVSSVISTSMANRQSLKNQREAQAWSEAMNEQQQQWQEKMWNMNNEYNAPSAQVSRLAKAGINPNSAVGGMSQAAAASLPQQPSIPGVDAAPVFPFDTRSLSNLGDHLRQSLLFDAEKDNLEADTKSKLADAGSKEANATLLLEQAKGVRLDNEVKPDMLSQTLTNLKEEASRIIAEAQLSQEQKRQVKFTVDELLPLTKSMSLKEIDKASQDIATSMATEAHQYAAASRERAEAGLAGAQTEQVKELTKGVKVDNEFKEIFYRLQRAKDTEEIMSMKLSNYEKNYFVRQLRKFGINVSENQDITMLAKLAMLKAKGFIDADTYDELTGEQRAGDWRKFGEGLVNKVLDVAGQAMSAWIVGKTAGTAFGKSSSKGVSEGTRSLNTNGYQYSSTSASTWNPSMP